MMREEAIRTSGSGAASPARADAVASDAHGPANPYDAIVVGTGPGGAAVARELAAAGQQVLLLERGTTQPSGGGMLRMLRSLDSAEVADGLRTTRALMVGGTTNIYFGVAAEPPLARFDALGIDLRPALARARALLPISEVPDRYVAPQVHRVGESARALGFPWRKTRSVLIDFPPDDGPKTDVVPWTAGDFVSDACASGAELRVRSEVKRILIEDGVATGVVYESPGRGRQRVQRQAFGRRIVLAAGGLASAHLLRRSGLAEVARNGFYCDPSFLMIGFVPGLRGGAVLPGSMGTGEEASGLLLGDGCISRPLFRDFMLFNAKFLRLFSHRRAVGVGVMVKDRLGGELADDGTLEKSLMPEDREKLEQGLADAGRIIRKTGARGIFASEPSASHVGGMLAIGSDVDRHLATSVPNLHVCDGSVLPEDIRVQPTLPLVCLGLYLADALMRREDRERQGSEPLQVVHS